MDSMTVASILPGAEDPVYGVIERVYAKKPGDYAIYRTDGRLLIQFADDETLETAQRGALAPLGPLRSQINALIDGWRREKRAHMVNKVGGLDRETADALVLALEGDSASAVLQLNSVRNGIINDRISFARFVYLAIAAGIAVTVSLVIAVLASMSVGIPGTSIGGVAVVTAMLGGLAGAFFSIATGLSKRTILPDATGSDNILDAILRMVIGLISAAILICLMRAGFSTTFQFVPSPAEPIGPAVPVPWMQLVTLGFLAGFSERLVPDLLEKAAGSVQVIAPPVTPLIPTPPSAAIPDLKAAKAASVANPARVAGKGAVAKPSPQEAKPSEKKTPQAQPPVAAGQPPA